MLLLGDVTDVKTNIASLSGLQPSRLAFCSILCSLFWYLFSLVISYSQLISVRSSFFYQNVFYFPSQVFIRPLFYFPVSTFAWAMHSDEQSSYDNLFYFQFQQLHFFSPCLVPLWREWESEWITQIFPFVPCIFSESRVQVLQSILPMWRGRRDYHKYWFILQNLEVSSVGL